MTINEETNKCDSKKATHVVGWGGKLHICCSDHAHQLQVLGSVIGSPTEARPIITSEKCYMAESEEST